MNLRRLKLLEKAVREQPEGEFRMDFWCIRSECGTAFCAAGAYAHRYPGNGLRLSREYHWDDDRLIRDLVSEKSGEIGLDACAEVFGLSERQATSIFAPSGYQLPTKPNVLRRISSYIRKAERERAGRKEAKR